MADGLTGTGPSAAPAEAGAPAAEESSGAAAQDAATAALSKAAALRTEGNSLFQRGLQFAKHTLGKNSMIEACSKYALALETLQLAMEDAPAARDQPEYREALLTTYLNLAAAGLQIEPGESVINCCNAALELDPNNAKALFRRGKARAALHEYTAALADLLAAAHANPKSKQIREEYKTVKADKARHEAAEAFRRETEAGLKRMALEKARDDGPLEADPDAPTDRNGMEPPGSAKVVELSDDDEDSAQQVPGAVDQPEQQSAAAPESRSTQAREPSTEDSLAGDGHSAATQTTCGSQAAAVAAPSRQWAAGLGLAHLTTNGGETPRHVWGQTIDTVHILVPVALGTRAREIDCKFNRLKLALRVGNETRLAGDLSFPVTVDECTWEIEEAGCLHVTLVKENCTRESSTAGFEWWPAPFQNDPAIDVAHCAVGNDLRELPGHTKSAMERAMWDEKNKTPEERAADEELRKANAQMAKDAASMEASRERAMKDPKKKAVFEMMREKFPDIPVEFR